MKKQLLRPLSETSYGYDSLSFVQFDSTIGSDTWSPLKWPGSFCLFAALLAVMDVHWSVRVGSILFGLLVVVIFLREYGGRYRDLLDFTVLGKAEVDVTDEGVMIRRGERVKQLAWNALRCVYIRLNWNETPDDLASVVALFEFRDGTILSHEHRSLRPLDQLLRRASKSRARIKFFHFERLDSKEQWEYVRDADAWPVPIHERRRWPVQRRGGLVPRYVLHELSAQLV